MATKDQVQKVYGTPLSLSEWLPWVEYVTTEGLFVLEDHYSVGVMFEVSPVPVEARGQEFVSKVDEDIQNMLNSAVPQEDPPFHMDVFSYDENSLREFKRDHNDLVRKKSKDPKYAAFTEQYLNVVNDHLDRISNLNGYFVDDVVTKAPWRGLTRKTKCFLYRRINGPDDLAPGQTPESEMNAVFEAVKSSLQDAGMKVVRQGAKDLYEWLFPWFNSGNELCKGLEGHILDHYPYPGDENIPFGTGLDSLMFMSQPISKASETEGYWDFDGTLHQGVSVNNLRSKPVPGQLSAELPRGDKFFAVLDKFPSDAIFRFSIVFVPHDQVESKLMAVRSNAKGDHHEANAALRQAERALEDLANGEKMFPVSMSVMLKSDSTRGLVAKRREVESLLMTAGFSILRERDELLPVHNYIKSLPMNYEYRYENMERRSRLFYSCHLAKILPFYGRSRGTDTPGLPIFNRGAESIGVDFISDRIMNAFGVLLGPPGSGKSSLAQLLIWYFIAVHNARVFILEKGGSFEILGEIAAETGLSVNQVKLTTKADYALSPFAEAIKVAAEDAETEADLERKDLEDQETLYEWDEEALDEYKRDYLGEMESSARIMITGGEKKEEDILMRSDRVLIRNAIKIAGRKKLAKIQADPSMSDELKIVLPEEIAGALEEISRDESLSEESRRSAGRMSMNMRLFCDGTAGHFFNRPGKNWHEADVTILEFGVLANEGYEDQLALAFMSLMNRIAYLVERDEAEERPTIILGDEAHLYIKNPLLAVYFVKIIKMFRKLGCWPWLATQNCEDFTEESNKMLNMFEWFIALTPPKQEIDNIAKFRNLSEEEKQLMGAARKAKFKYTEGVILSNQMKALFRNVPPPLILASAMTEKDEKVERRLLMKQHGVSKSGAARMVAERIARRDAL